MEGEKVILDMYTGEIINTIGPNDKVKITRSEQVENFRRIQEAKKAAGTAGVEIRKGVDFIKLYSDVLSRLSKRLSGAECQFILYLVQFIRYRSGTLSKKAKPGGTKEEPLAKQDIIEGTGLSQRTVERLLQGLQDKQVIGRHGTGKEVYYTVNPYIFMRGSAINETLHQFYKSSTWAKEGKGQAGDR